MSKNPGSAKKEASGTQSSRERIIPIVIEGDDAKQSNTQILTRTQSRKKETSIQATIICKNEDMETTHSIESLPLSPSYLPQQDNTSPSLDLPERPVPPIFVPEKIILIVDRSLDDNYTYFEQKSGKKYTPLCMIQHAIQIFLHNKHSLSSEHEYALMTLNDNSATWVHGFTNSPQDIIASLTSLKPCTNEDIFVLNSVFDIINKQVLLPKVDGVATPYVVRAILIYDRSYSIPVLHETPEVLNLLNSPLFTLDVIMTHEPPSAGNHCNKIFETLQKLDTKGFAYSFSVSRNSQDLSIAMAKVLGHSLQRPPQSVLDYDITKFKL